MLDDQEQRRLHNKHTTDHGTVKFRITHLSSQGILRSHLLEVDHGPAKTFTEHLDIQQAPISLTSKDHSPQESG